MTFQDFAIDPRCLRVLTDQGITLPTPVQREAIPPALEGRDVVALAQTGTGKTLAYGLPALTRLAAGRPEPEQSARPEEPREVQEPEEHHSTQWPGTWPRPRSRKATRRPQPPKGRRPRNRMLIIVPTRELAVQVNTALQLVGRTLGLTSVAVYGGAGMEPQVRALHRGVDFIVACPGRLLDHMGRGNVRFDDLEMLVLDEADRMLDMGFLPDIKRILAKVPARRQTLMFSATFPREVEHLAAEFHTDPVRVEVGPVAAPATAVTQGLYTVDPKGKMGLLSKLLAGPEVKSALVFLRTKHRTDRVARALGKAGFPAQAIHGGRSQNQRQHALKGFSTGRFRILVATDVAARGLDIRGVTHVVNYDIPTTADDYIHRIGRTARADATGDAITFASPEDRKSLDAIEKHLGKALPRTEWEGAVAMPSVVGADKGEKGGKKPGAGGSRWGVKGQKKRRFGGGPGGNKKGGRRGAGRPR